MTLAADKLPVYPELLCAAILPSGRRCHRPRYAHLHLPPGRCTNEPVGPHHRYVPPARHRHEVPLRPKCWTDWP